MVVVLNLKLFDFSCSSDCLFVFILIGWVLWCFGWGVILKFIILFCDIIDSGLLVCLCMSCSLNMLVMLLFIGRLNWFRKVMCMLL